MVSLLGRAQHFELLEKLVLLLQLPLQFVQLLHFPGRNNELFAMVLGIGLLFLLLLLVHEVQAFLLVLKLGLHSDLAQR